MTNKTRLNDVHREMGGKMVDFGGWDMPLHYGSQMKEHNQVRAHSGMFDVSHMTVVDLAGPAVEDFLSYLLANDIAVMAEPGRALYSVMLNPEGGVIDDLIVYFRGPNAYRLVVNCATREKDLAWMNAQAGGYEVSIEERPELGIVAVQGPQARAAFSQAYPGLVPEDMPGFRFCESGGWMIATTGYTGEDGFEIILPNEDIEALWKTLSEHGVEPAGLGARDTLRLEAGYCLYGHEMDEQTLPWSANLGWTVNLKRADRDFLGRSVIEPARADKTLPKLVGLVLQDKGVLRAEQKVITSEGLEGVITSGSYSPTLEKSIALARLPMSVSDHCDVLVRDRKLRAKIVKPAFVRLGKALV